MQVRNPHAGFRFALAILASRDNWMIPEYWGIATNINPLKGMDWFLRINGFEDQQERHQIMVDWIKWGPKAKDYYTQGSVSGIDNF